tara:strand:- start:311 stop:826 length:516 start_codon:yes stop_codon:yes gene_type:complete
VTSKKGNVKVGDNVEVGEAVAIAKSPYSKKVGFTCGAFDLLHTGHVLMLEEAKSVCDYLIVGVQSDPSIDRPGKNKPIQSYKERLIMVHGIKFVDEVVTYETEAELLEILKDLEPDIRILGEDHKGKPFTGDDLPFEIYFNSRDHDWSTSNLRKRVYESEKAKVDWNNARR